MDTWRVFWRRAVKTSLCVSYRENQYKFLMHWYHTPSLLNKLNPNISNLCWRCGKHRGTQFNLFWERPGIQTYWINNLLYDVLGIRFPLEPQLFLLNVTDCAVPKFVMKLLLHILTAARCLIALFWMRSMPSASLDLLTRIKDIRIVEYMTAISYNRADLFHKIWAPWDLYCADNDIWNGFVPSRSVHLLFFLFCLPPLYPTVFSPVSPYCFEVSVYFCKLEMLLIYIL